MTLLVTTLLQKVLVSVRPPHPPRISCTDHFSNRKFQKHRDFWKWPLSSLGPLCENVHKCRACSATVSVICFLGCTRRMVYINRKSRLVIPSVGEDEAQTLRLLPIWSCSSSRVRCAVSRVHEKFVLRHCNHNDDAKSNFSLLWFCLVLYNGNRSQTSFSFSVARTRDIPGRFIVGCRQRHA